MARWKAHGQLFIHVNWTFFAVCYDSRVMRRNVYSSAVFAEGRPLYTQIFTWTGSSPSNHSWHQKARHWTIRRRRPHPSAFPCFYTIPECDGQTDGRTDKQTDGFAVVYTALAKPAL